MSSPSARYPLHRLTGQFHDPDREAMYRQDIAPRVRRESFVTLIVAALVFGMFAISDYHFVGVSTALYLLLAMRLVVVVSCLVLAFVIGRLGDYSLRPWLHALPLWILGRCHQGGARTRLEGAARPRGDDGGCLAMAGQQSRGLCLVIHPCPEFLPACWPRHPGSRSP